MKDKPVAITILTGKTTFNPQKHMVSSVGFEPTTP